MESESKIQIAIGSLPQMRGITNERVRVGAATFSPLFIVVFVKVKQVNPLLR